MAVGFFFPTVFPDILEPSQEDVSILNFIKNFKLYKKKIWTKWKWTKKKNGYYTNLGVYNYISWCDNNHISWLITSLIATTPPTDGDPRRAAGGLRRRAQHRREVLVGEELVGLSRLGRGGLLQDPQGNQRVLHRVHGRRRHRHALERWALCITVNIIIKAFYGSACKNY